MTGPATNKKTNYTNQDSELHIHYWKRQLADASSQIEFECDLPKPAPDIYRKTFFHFTISKVSVKALNLISSQYDASLPIVFLSAFNTLIYRYIHQADLVIGLPSVDYTNSDGKLTEIHCGLITLRTNFSKNPSFAELIKSTRQTLDSAYCHKNVPNEVFEDALS